MMRFQIGPLRAAASNLLANDFVAGLPSPGAALGFAGALLYHAGIKDWSHRVFMLLHSVECRKGRQRAHPSVDGGLPKPIEIMEGLAGNVVFTLIVHTPHPVADSSLSQALNLMRFAGGTLTPYQRNANEDIFLLDKRVESLVSNAALESLRLPRGYALVPPRAGKDMDIVSFGDYATLCRLRNRGYARQKGQGYCVPVACGYRLLEDPRNAKRRQGSREGQPHVFAEPAVGLGEFMSIRNRSLSIPVSELDPFMWKWSCDFDRHLVMFSPDHLRILTEDTL